MNTKEYNEEAVQFFRENSKYYNHNFLIDIQKDTLHYVKSNPKFKYKDDVEAGVLKTTLITLGYIEFIKKEKDINFYQVTEYGKEFIKNHLELEFKRR